MSALATVPPAPAVTADHLALIRRTIAKDATDTELELFLYDNARRGLHPLDRLLHFTKRGGKYTPVTSIDLMRSRAAATGEYAGQDDAVFGNTPTASSSGFIALGPAHPGFFSSVTVYRLVQGQRCPFTATARWSEYKPDQDFIWRRMPHVMLGKCAEALALRKAFPQELAGLYEASELAQADNGGAGVDRATGEMLEPGAEPPAPRPSTADRPITAPQRKRLFALAGAKGWTHPLIKDALKAKFNLDSTEAITRGQYDDVCASFEETPPRDPDEPF